MKANEFLRQVDALSEKRLFLFCGSEHYLLSAAQKEILKALDIQIPDMNIAKLDARADAEQIQAAAEQMPCFSSVRALILEDLELFSKGDPGPLLDYLPGANRATALLFIYHGNPDKRRALYKYLAKAAVVVEAEPLSEGELVKWIIAKAKKRGVNCKPEVARRLMEVAGREMDVLESEIEKLCLAGENPLTVQLVEALAAPSREYNVFLLHEFLLAGNYKEAFRLLQQIYAAEKSYIPLIGLLSSKFLPMYMAKCCLNAGYTPAKAASEIATRAKIHPYAAKLAVQECQKFKVQQLRNAIKLLGEWDRALKSGGATPGAEAMLLKIYDVGGGKLDKP